VDGDEEWSVKGSLHALYTALSMHRNRSREAGTRKLRVKRCTVLNSFECRATHNLARNRKKENIREADKRLGLHV